MKKQAVTAIMAVLCAAPAWALYKCPAPGGGTTFQDMPCEGGAQMHVRPASGAARAPAKPAPETGTAAATATVAPVAPVAPQPAPVAQQPAVRDPSPLDPEARMCLAWYRPMLRDPNGAYYTSPSKEGRVLSIDIHATNGFGGYVIKRASCEINAGRLDESWTKIHATRSGWHPPH